MNDGKDFARDARAFGDSSTPGSASFTADVKPKLIRLTGTATSATGASAALTGVGTRLNTELRAGDRVFIDGTDVGEIASVTNNKHGSTCHWTSSSNRW